MHSRSLNQPPIPSFLGLQSPYSKTYELGQPWLLVSPKLQSKQSQRSGAEVHLVSGFCHHPGLSLTELSLVPILLESEATGPSSEMLPT